MNKLIVMIIASDMHLIGAHEMMLHRVREIDMTDLILVGDFTEARTPHKVPEMVIPFEIKELPCVDVYDLLPPRKSKNERTYYKPHKNKFTKCR